MVISTTFDPTPSTPSMTTVPIALRIPPCYTALYLRQVDNPDYIGSLLLWKVKDENLDLLSCEAIYGFEGKGSPTDIVLDGQQRLTAMHYAFAAPDVQAPRRRNRCLYFIKVDRFVEQDYDDAFEYDWRPPRLAILSHREQQFKWHRFPLSVIGEGGFALAKWVQGYESYWRQLADAGEGAEADQAQMHADNGQRFGEYVNNTTQQYQISYIELAQDTLLEKVCEIFTKINSRGIRLDTFDLINALLRPKGLQLRSDLWREAAPRLEFVQNRRMNLYVLQVMSILRQAYCSPKYLYYLLPGSTRQVRGVDGVVRPEVLVADTDEFKDRWNASVSALEHAIDLLSHP